MGKDAYSPGECGSHEAKLKGLRLRSGLRDDGHVCAPDQNVRAAHQKVQQSRVIPRSPNPPDGHDEPARAKLCAWTLLGPDAPGC